MTRTRKLLRAVRPADHVVVDGTLAWSGEYVEGEKLADSGELVRVLSRWGNAARVQRVGRYRGSQGIVEIPIGSPFVVSVDELEVDD